MCKKIGIIGIILTAILSLSLLFAGCGGGGDDTGVRKSGKAQNTEKAEQEAKYTAYLITMDQGSNYWQQIDEGCRQAAKELGDVNYKWVAPLNHKDNEQEECIDQAIAAKADAILISAISPEGENSALDRAAKAGIKVVYVDSAATHPAVATLLTDNEKAGIMAGKTMLKVLTDNGITSGTIGLGANQVAKNGILRDKGFRSVFEGTAFTVAPTVPMNGDPRNIKNFVKETPDFIAYFGANEQITRAFSEQVKDSGTKQVIVGFDTSDFTLTMIKEGIIYATMQQDPKRMGREGLKIAIEAVKGEYKGKEGEVIDLGVNVITRDKI